VNEHSILLTHQGDIHVMNGCIYGRTRQEVALDGLASISHVHVLSNAGPGPWADQGLPGRERRAEVKSAMPGVSKCLFSSGVAFYETLPDVMGLCICSRMV